VYSTLHPAVRWLVTGIDRVSLAVFSHLHITAEDDDDNNDNDKVHL